MGFAFKQSDFRVKLHQVFYMLYMFYMLYFLYVEFKPFQNFFCDWEWVIWKVFINIDSLFATFVHMCMCNILSP